ncbi:NAD(P)/FAD-dependent oxidoreductase [Microbulbifer sp. THAF38]|uniref:flavin-containing monooxygenase n=1 Tax=Microbulbifer sp. THAF38 TaxID=2587856 RepID=UPI001268034B|nr:NAD(P)-binding domain-containing protein [Microbulbifer sp. THAF38]QFT55095.1 4-hydroxyacetophenone monooxygenase [Microbulbifer sp. THAF38]
MKPYAVIGAGPMGLCTVRNLLRLGIPCIGFEVHSDVGGLWDINSPTSTMYESAHLISSKRMTEFADFPMDESVADYPSHRDMGDYFRSYAREFGLYGHYEFDTEVVQCVRSGDGWLVTTRRNWQEKTREFSGLLIASGTLHYPNQPELPGQYTGKLIHSSQYRSPEIFAGKRVLLIGCGNSGADIAVDAVHRARSVDISLRRGYHFLPKYFSGRPIDQLGGKFKLPLTLKRRLTKALIRLSLGSPSQYGLPEPKYQLFESHPVVNSLLLHHIGHGDINPRPAIKSVDGHKVHFSAGECEEYDLIVQATGYKLHYPFVDKAELNWNGYAPSLYLNIFHPKSDNLFMMGMIEAAGLGWEGRNMQAELVALYVHQLIAGVSSANRFRKVIQQKSAKRIDGGMRYLDLERMAYYVHKDSYLKVIKKHKADLLKDLSPRALTYQAGGLQATS